MTHRADKIKSLIIWDTFWCLSLIIDLKYIVDANMSIIVVSPKSMNRKKTTSRMGNTIYVKIGSYSVVSSYNPRFPNIWILHVHTFPFFPLQRSTAWASPTATTPLRKTAPGTTHARRARPTYTSVPRACSMESMNATACCLRTSRSSICAHSARSMIPITHGDAKEENRE